MANFPPLIGKTGKNRGLIAGTDDLLVPKVGAAGSGDTVALSATSATAADNGSGAVGFDGTNLFSNISSTATTVAQALVDADTHFGNFDSTVTLKDATANSDVAGDTIFDINEAANNTSFDFKGAAAHTATTAEKPFKVIDSASAEMLSVGTTTAAGNMQMLLDSGVLQVDSDGTNATLSSSGSLIVSSNSDFGTTTIDMGAATELDVPAGTAFSIAGTNLTTANFTAANMDDLLDGSDASSLHNHDTDYVELTGDTMSGALAMGTNKITGLGAGTASTDAINKSQLDAATLGLSWKDAVVLKSAANVASLTGITASDFDGTAQGVTLATGDRVLLGDDQTTNSNQDRGIYEYDGADLVRAEDMDGGTEADGAAVFVMEGTYADTGWIQTTDNVTIGTTVMVWSQFTSGVTNTAGDGIDISTGVISTDLAAAGAGTGGLTIVSTELAVLAGDGIELTASGVAADLAAAGAGTGGLEIVSNEIAVNAGDGIELTASGVAVDLLATSGLSFSTGELQLDDSVAGTGISIASKVMSVDYGSTASTAVEGDTTFAAAAGAGLTGGQASAALGGGISYTMTVGAGNGIVVNADDVEVNQDTVEQVLTNATSTTTSSDRDIMVMNASGTINPGDANDAFSDQIVGIAAQAHSATATATVFNIPGSVIGGFTGLTAGATQYLSETAGALTATAPTTSGAQVVRIGHAISTTELFYSPQFMYSVA
jgi:hypothetical protein